MSGRTAALVARTALDGEEVSPKVLSHVSWRCSTICGQLGVKEPLRGKVQKGNFPAELGNPAKRRDFYFPPPDDGGFAIPIFPQQEKIAEPLRTLSVCCLPQTKNHSPGDQHRRRTDFTPISRELERPSRNQASCTASSASLDLYPQLEPLIEESGLDSSGMMNL